MESRKYNETSMQFAEDAKKQVLKHIESILVVSKGNVEWLEDNIRDLKALLEEEGKSAAEWMHHSYQVNKDDLQSAKATTEMLEALKAACQATEI